MACEKPSGLIDNKEQLKKRAKIKMCSSEQKMQAFLRGGFQ